MASLSPQRPRRPQAQQANQGPIHIHQQREASRSPTLLDRERPRAAKTQSMPMVPSITAFPPQPPQPAQNTQPSPSLPNNGGRRSPIGQVQRLLPTPPHNNPPTFDQERRLSPPPVQQQTMNLTNGNQHYARSAPRAPAASYPNRHQNLEEHWQMTPELLAEIELAAHQHSQFQANQSYPPQSNGESPPSIKGPSLERVRAADRLSPINLDNQRGRRDQQPRDSPKTGGRHPASPMSSSIEATLTPENRSSPSPLGPESHPANATTHYNSREPPPVLRRAPAAEQRINQSIVNQTPPLQAVAARNPDRSLPVQEEDEHSRSSWQDTDTLVESQFSSSPTPSSDLNPDGKVQAGQHDDDKKKTITHDEDRSQYANRDSTEEENGYTPRSPTVPLPEDNNDSYYAAPNVIRVPVPVPLRPKGRNGSGDHIMRGLESTLMDANQSHPVPTAPVPQQQQSQPPKYSEHRQPSQPQPQPNPNQYQKSYPPQEYGYAQQPIRGQNGQYLPPQPQVYPDDFQYADDATSAYIQSYLSSPRPDAPIPPTPHNATAAPSPSPVYRPSQRAAGSPYPFPFNHVRRNRQNQNSRLIANGLDPAAITEQIARQWQIYAQNNQGYITDSTLSPSTTPFQGDLFNQWASLHTNRMMKGFHEAPSLHSSPSHQPVPLPMPHFGAKKKDKTLNVRKQSFSRKPPPRVQSTQPRDTSPELSSSGEETAGDDRANPTPDIAPPSANGISIPVLFTDIPIEILDAEDVGEWVDEDDEDDYDDLIDLEYHPSFIKNVSKRRRKWEVGWENLIQAFQALDRQTDATMILLASPSHSTKLHALRSRSIRRQPGLSGSTNMDDIRGNFSRLATQRRKTRPDKSSLVDRLAIASSASGGDGSDGSAQSVEENLRRALDAALGSLGALGQVYEEREARVLEELRHSREDRERVELLLKQVLGDNNPLSNPVPIFSPDRRAAQVSD